MKYDTETQVEETEKPLDLDAVRFAIRLLMGGKTPDDLDRYSERRLRALMYALVPNELHERMGDDAPGVDLTLVKFCVYQARLGNDLEEIRASQEVAH